MKPGAKTSYWVAFAISVLIVMSGGTSYIVVQRLLEANKWVIHTHEVREQLENIISTLKDAETGGRGFLLAGKENYLEPFNTAVSVIDKDIDSLVALTRDNSAQQESIEQVRKLTDEKLALLQEAINLRKSSGSQAALRIVQSGRGEQIMDELRSIIAEMQTREQQLLEARNTEANASANLALTTIALWMPVSLLVLAIILVVTMRLDQFRNPVGPAKTSVKKWTNIAIQYVSAVSVVAVAAIMRWKLMQSFGPLPTFVTFYPAVLFMASIGGAGPGLFTTALSAATADYFFIPPIGQFAIEAPGDIVGMAIFTGTNVFLCILAEQLRRSRWAEAVTVAQQDQLEEMSQQNEELASQSEELAVQNEELQSQSEEIQALNTQLKAREKLLQMLLDSARFSTGEEAVLREICSHTIDLFGESTATTVMVSEMRVDKLIVRALAGVGEESPDAPGYWPTEHSFASIVIEENRTLCINDVSLRPDLSILTIPGQAPFQAVVCTPMKKDGKAIGAVAVYSQQVCEWTAEQFRLAEWLADQCSHILDTLRLQESLSQAKAEAESANQTKSLFLANMSHEIRTPLVAILGFSELLNQANLSESERQKYTEIIIRNGAQLTTIIDDILDFSKIEAGRLSIIFKKVSLAQIVGDVNQTISSKANKKGVVIKTKLSASLPAEITTDATRLKQILMNLLGNAVKFTPAGGEIKVEGEAVRGSVVLTVSDNGMGIPAKDHEKIFEPFAQADSSISVRFGGTGLGLALSRRLAQALGGELFLKESNIGKGSVFAVRLPIKGISAADLPPETKAQAPDEAHNKKLLKNLRVLLAEDMEDNVVLVKKILSNCGAEINVAGNGQEAVEKALSHHYDVILMDIRMPVMDGLDATRKLRGQGYNGHIIAFTAHALEEERRASFAAGCDDHISKPISADELVKVLEQIKSDA